MELLFYHCDLIKEEKQYFYTDTYGAVPYVCIPLGTLVATKEM